MVSENIQERMREPVKASNVDISVPVVLKSNKKTYEQLQVFIFHYFSYFLNCISILFLISLVYLVLHSVHQTDIITLYVALPFFLKMILCIIGSFWTNFMNLFKVETFLFEF